MLEGKHKRDLKYSLGFPWEETDEALKEELSLKKEPKQKTRSQAGAWGEFIYGRDLKWYKEVILWPMFLLLIIELGVRVLQTKYLYLWNEQIFSYLIYGARVILFGYLAVAAVKLYRADKAQVLFAAALGGLLTGFVLAIFQFFWYLELWTFFNLVGQPLLMMFMGVAIAWLVVNLLIKFKK